MSSIATVTATKVLLEETKSRTNDTKEEHQWKEYLDHGSIRVKQKIEGRKKIERRESYETNKNWGSGIRNGVGWLFGRQRIRSGRSHRERGCRRGLLSHEISCDSPTHFVERQSASETKSHR